MKIDSPVLEVRRGPAAGRATSHVWSRLNPGSLGAHLVGAVQMAQLRWRGPNGRDPRRAPLSRRQHGGMQSL